MKHLLVKKVSKAECHQFSGDLTTSVYYGGIPGVLQNQLSYHDGFLVAPDRTTLLSRTLGGQSVIYLCSAHRDIKQTSEILCVHQHVVCSKMTVLFSSRTYPGLSLMLATIGMLLGALVKGTKIRKPRNNKTRIPRLGRSLMAGKEESFLIIVYELEKENYFVPSYSALEPRVIFSLFTRRDDELFGCCAAALVRLQQTSFCSARSSTIPLRLHTSTCKHHTNDNTTLQQNVGTSASSKKPVGV